MFEYSIIPITRRKDGSYFYDYSLMQRYIDLCTEAGFSGDIEVFGLVNVWRDEKIFAEPLCEDYPEEIRLRYLDEADGCIKYVRDGEVIKDYIRSLERYFIETEQIERVRIAADEPGHIDRYRASLEMLMELAPRFKCKCAINHADFIAEFHDRIDDFVPYLRCTLNEYERLMSYREQFPEKTFLWYVCCGGAHPNTYLCSRPIESRLIGLMTSYLRLDGFLRWAFNIWPEDPRKEIRYSHFEAGDTCFVYPAANGKPLLSLRYKNLQRGIADYELLERARAKHGDEAADALLKTVLRFRSLEAFDPKSNAVEEAFSLCWADYNDLKRKLIELQ